MENTNTRRFIITLAVVTVLAGIFTLPVLGDDYAVDAASKKVKVKYKANGGKFTAKKYTQKKTVTKKVTKDKKVGTAPKIKRTGYKLKGWYTKKNGGSKITRNSKTKKNRTLYARWTPKKYTIKFDSNGGSAVNSKTVTYGKSYGSLPEPTRNYYQFAGWFTSEGKKVKSTTTYKTARNTVLYARWDTVAVTGITLSQTELGFYSVEVIPVQLTATVLPANASNKNVIWHSSNPEIATVDANGLVQANPNVMGATAVITATTEDNNKTATCIVTVNPVGCFTEDTNILTITGNKHVKDITPGELVWSRDELTGECDWKPVSKVHRHEGITDLIHITSDGNLLKATPNHPIYVEGSGFIRADMIRTGDLLYGIDGYQTVSSIEKIELSDSISVYNLTVSDFHTYFAGGVWVHNK